MVSRLGWIVGLLRKPPIASPGNAGAAADPLLGPVPGTPLHSHGPFASPPRREVDPRRVDQAMSRPLLFGRIIPSIQNRDDFSLALI